MLFATPALAEAKAFASECERVYAVYPRLMLASMLEADVNCGDPDSGEFVSCYEGEAAEQQAARLKRLAVRQAQEAAYKVATDSCRAWESDPRSEEMRAALSQAIAAARATDRGAAQPK